MRKILTATMLLAVLISAASFLLGNSFAASYTEEYLTPPLTIDDYVGGYVADDTGMELRKVDIKGNLREYYLHAPVEGYGKPRPVLIMLHGDGRTGASMIDMWRSLSDAEGVILAAPNALDQRWAKELGQITVFAAIIEDIKEQYQVDESRIYLFGHSGGAIYAFSHALSGKAGMFAAVLGHAGVVRRLSAASSSLYKKIAGDQPPVSILVGSNDHIFSVDASRQTAKALVAMSHDTKLFIVDGHNHWYYTMADYINQTLWDSVKDYRK